MAIRAEPAELDRCGRFGIADVPSLDACDDLVALDPAAVCPAKAAARQFEWDRPRP